MHRYPRAKLLLSVMVLISLINCVDDDDPVDEPTDIYLSGTLAADTTIASNSILHLNETLLVPSGITLTIESNVEVACSSSVLLRLTGQLVVIGTAENKVVFNSSSDEKWAGILVESEGVIEMTYAIVSNATNGMQYYGEACNLTHCSFRLSDGYGLYIQDVENQLVLNNCTFDDNVTGIELLNSSLQISDCVFSNNSERGIVSRGSQCIISQSVFSDNYISLLSDNSDHSVVSECDFNGNFIGIYYRISAYINLVNSNLSNNQYHLQIGQQNWQNRHNLLCEGNNFMSFHTYAIRLTEVSTFDPYTLQLGVNYYNTTDSIAITEMMFDVFDDPNCDTLQFVPFAMTPF